MATFKSIVATKDGREQRVWLPLTEEGFLEPVVDECVAMGVLLKDDGKPYTQPELEVKRAEIRKRLREQEIAALKKRKPF